MDKYDCESTPSQSPIEESQLSSMQSNPASISASTLQLHSSHNRVPIFQIRYPSSGTCTFTNSPDLHTSHALHLDHQNQNKNVSPTNEDEIFPLLEQHSAIVKPDARSFPPTGKAPPLGRARFCLKNQNKKARVFPLIFFLPGCRKLFHAISCSRHRPRKRKMMTPMRMLLSMIQACDLQVRSMDTKWSTLWIGSIISNYSSFFCFVFSSQLSQRLRTHTKAIAFH